MRREADDMARRISEMRGQILAEKRERVQDKRDSASSRWRSSSSIKHKGEQRRRRRRRAEGGSRQRGGSSRGSSRGAQEAAPPSRSERSRGRLRGGFGDSKKRQMLTKAADPDGGTASPPTSARRREAASEWSEDEVSQWLERIGLPQYQAMFKANAINGAALVDVDKSDLDYIGIKALGHRKMLLAGIAEIKMDQSSAAATSTETQTSTTSSAKALPKKVHWLDAAKKSDADPNKKSAPLPPVSNLLDGDYDEARERERFRSAVMAWRNGGDSATAAAADTAPAPAAKNEGGKLLEGKYDEARERKRFEDAVMEWRNGGKAAPAEETSEWVNPFGPVPADHPPPSEDGGKLLKGTLDEEAEQQMFKQAVLDWRKGDSGAKMSCWQCFKLFSPNNNVLKAGDKKFCKEACHSTFVAAAKAAEKKKTEDIAAAQSPKAGKSSPKVGKSSPKAGSPKVGKNLFRSALITGDAAASAASEVEATDDAKDDAGEGGKEEEEDDPRAKLISFLNWDVDIKY